MKKNLIVKQDGWKECGAASLLSIIRYYHGNISIQRLVELTHTDKTGTNFYQLKMAAEKLGLSAIGYQVDKIESLYELDKPFICQFVDNSYEHFVVVYSITKNKVEIMDPAVGKKEISKEQFLKLHTGYILVFEPVKKLYYVKEQKYLKQVMIEILTKNKGIVLNILFLSIVFTCFSCFYTLYFQIVLDKVIDFTKINLLWITFFFAILLLIKTISSFFRNELLIYFNQKLDWSLFYNTFQKILLLPYNYYKNKTTGEMISRINDLIYVRNILNKLILTVFLDGIIFLVSGFILWYINSRMFLILIIVILVYILVFCIFRPVLERYTNRNQKNTAELNSLLTESIEGFETIKNIGIESIIERRIGERYLKKLNDCFLYENMGNLEFLLKELISSIGILLIEFIGFLSVLNRDISLGRFLSYILFLNYFIGSIQNILSMNKEFFYAKNSIRRINQILDVDLEELQTKTGIIPQGKILFQNVSFSYNDEKNILCGLNFQIDVGEKVIILGDSGSGKSTIFRLLMKYFSVMRDSIYLDDIDLEDYTKGDIREHIGCISQNEILYTDTIRNNITLHEKIDTHEFLEICRLTYVDDFVKNMFLGYETKLEENGQNLSGGQRQRIILARLLFRKRNILLIDEGLNAIDVDLERKILKNIFSKYTNKTILIVSHRMENLDLFDKVIWLANGKIKDIIVRPKEDSVYDR